MPKLDEQLVAKFKGRKITGRIIGIDFYQLENLDGKKLRWPSYTLVSETGGLFKRYWITDWGKSGWFLWTGVKKFKTKNRRVKTERSGLAKIEFAGDQGASTPVAVLVVFEKQGDTFHSIERFSDSATMYFTSRKIRKPTVKR